MSKDFELFKGKSFSDLMSDIYHNSKKKERQINTLIQELQPLIKNVSDATVLVPLIKEYLEVSVKNDEHLVKLAAIVQRLVSSSTKSENDGDPGNFGLTEEEKEALLKEAENSIIELQKEQNATTSRS
jgi:hypothetical protein